MLERTGKLTPAQELTALANATHNRMRLCASGVRLEILMRLVGGPDTVSGLAKATGLDLPAISVHLAALRREGIVLCRPQRNKRIHYLSRAVRISQCKGEIQLRMDIPGGMPMCLFIDPAFINRLHPGYCLDGEPPPAG